MARQPISKAERKAVINRDGNACVRCSNTTALHVHHLTLVQDGGTNDPPNLITLCARCHKEWHYIEEHYTIPFDEWKRMPPYHILYGFMNGIAEFTTTQQAFEFAVSWKDRYTK